MIHFLYCPFTGLGLYGGYRGKRWLRNRIKIFWQFVLPAIISQTDRDFVLWFSWRYEERSNPIVQQFVKDLQKIKGLKTVHTYAGVCFWDDKYSDNEAYARLIDAVRESMADLLNLMGNEKEVLMTIQPSDDVYHSNMVSEVKAFFSKNKGINVFGYQKGYVMDYVNRRLAEWNPKTTPPFYTIRFPREVFADPLKHVQYTGPYKSHEYVKDFQPAAYVESRGFLVGTHKSNISTVFDHPYAGHEYLGDNVDRILSEFGLASVPVFKPSSTIRGNIFHLMPYKVKRKLRYWAEKNWKLRRIFSAFYNFIRS